MGCGERRSEVPRKMEIDVVKGRHALHNIFDIFAQVSGNRVLGYNSRSALPISQLEFCGALQSEDRETNIH